MSATTTPTDQILFLDTPLEILPALAAVPMMHEVLQHLATQNPNDPARKAAREEMEAEWKAFVDDVRVNGILEPCKVVFRVSAEHGARGGTHVLVDGRKRYTAALEAGILTIPCIEVSEDQVDAVIAGTVIGRQHWTKGMRAYFAVLLHPDVATGAKPGPKSNSRTQCGDSAIPALSAETLAEKFGVSLRLIEQACEIYRAFVESPSVRKRLEPSIFAGFGLGGILAGIGGAPDDTQRPPATTRPRSLEVASKAFANLGKYAGGFTEWTEVHKDAFRDQVRRVGAELPEELAELIAVNLLEHITPEA